MANYKQREKAENNNPAHTNTLQPVDLQNLPLLCSNPLTAQPAPILPVANPNITAITLIMSPLHSSKGQPGMTLYIIHPLILLSYTRTQARAQSTPNPFHQPTTHKLQIPTKVIHLCHLNVRRDVLILAFHSVGNLSRFLWRQLYIQ